LSDKPLVTRNVMLKKKKKATKYLTATFVM